MQNIYDSEEFRAQGHQIIDALADYLKSIEDGRLTEVIPYVEPEDSYDFWKKDLAEGQTGLMDFVTETIKRSNHLHHPKYMGHQVSAPSPVAALMGVVTGLLNNGGAVYEMGLVNNPLERVLSKYLAEKLGFGDESDGFLTSGGTLANLTALLAARAKYSSVWSEGTTEKLAIMVSEEAHYCVDRAARIMGLGESGIIKIPVNDRFKLKTELLEEYYQDATAKGFRVFAIIGSACSTSTGSYDNLQEIGEFAQKNNLWFHIDGAHGGAVTFSSKYKSLLKGVALADSIIIDWHKMLLAPALITAVVFKKGSDAYATFHQKAQYLWDNALSKDWFNSGKRTFECTKLMMSVKVYGMIKAHGDRIFEEHVDYLYDLAKTFANLIKSSNDFELGHEPEANIVCFRIKTENSNEINATIRRKLLEKGEFYIVSTTLNGDTYLRVSLMNQNTKVADLESLLENVKAIKSEL